MDNVLHGNHALSSVKESQDEDDKGQSKKSREEDQTVMKEDVHIAKIMKIIIVNVNKSQKQIEDVVDMNEETETVEENVTKEKVNSKEKVAIAKSPMKETVISSKKYGEKKE